MRSTTRADEHQPADVQPASLAPKAIEYSGFRPRDGARRCAFCGLNAHGTRWGRVRCMQRATRIARALGADNWKDTEDPGSEDFDANWSWYPYRRGMKGWTFGKPNPETISNMLPHIRAIWERPSSLTPNMFADTVGHAPQSEGRQAEGTSEAQSVE